MNNQEFTPDEFWRLVYEHPIASDQGHGNIIQYSYEKAIENTVSKIIENKNAHIIELEKKCEEIIKARDIEWNRMKYLLVDYANETSRVKKMSLKERGELLTKERDDALSDCKQAIDLLEEAKKLFIMIGYGREKYRDKLNDFLSSQKKKNKT